MLLVVGSFLLVDKLLGSILFWSYMFCLVYIYWLYFLFLSYMFCLRYIVCLVLMQSVLGSFVITILCRTA